ncbi:MAG: hypothetical protein Ct9H90mP16_15120 [Candidatus Poseidoniales archaeon]|nr:MAG: hypothetical protein Ct9H90mP16_15120 [Candidatus Poseidoniales archaeon]
MLKSNGIGDPGGWPEGKPLPEDTQEKVDEVNRCLAQSFAYGFKAHKGVEKGIVSKSQRRLCHRRTVVANGGIG